MVDLVQNSIWKIVTLPSSGKGQGLENLVYPHKRFIAYFLDKCFISLQDKPMWIFGAYGTSEDYLKDLSAITNNINDNLAVKEVIFVQKRNKEADSIKPWHKVLKGIKST